MTTCWACDTELRPEWKFCIHCGVPVEQDVDPAVGKQTRKPLTPIALFGWIFAGLGVVLLAAGIILFFVVQ